MSVTLNNNISNGSISNSNSLGFNAIVQNKEKNVAENRSSSCDSDKSGVILELSKEATQDGFVREKRSRKAQQRILRKLLLQGRLQLLRCRNIKHVCADWAFILPLRMEIPQASFLNKQ